MKTTEGFVLALPDGTFLWCGKVSTMVGFRHSFTVVNDIEDATVTSGSSSFGIMHDRTFLSALKEAGYGDYKLLPVRVTRTVELTGWGVPK